jgi:membrane protein implicated in regulation of membrane protease activity
MADVPGLGIPLSLLLLLAGAGLVVAEALAPGAHFIVLGVALLVAGLVGLLLPASLGAAIPFILAAVVLAAGATALWAYREFDFYGGRGSGQTSDSDSLRGRTARVTEPVSQTDGQVKLDEGGGFNPYYQARTTSGTIEVGQEVIVVDPGGGNVITVESLASIEDDIDRELARGRRESEDERSEETETA